jgi:uncharacterized protein YbcC (UPF0753/DUF2309 family)
MMIYPQDRLYQEMAYIAYHFHWPSEEILQMEHSERQRWVDEIASINTNLNALAEEGDAAATR